MHRLGFEFGSEVKEEVMANPTNHPEIASMIDAARRVRIQDMSWSVEEMADMYSPDNNGEL